jgi:hypothetical protein
MGRNAKVEFEIELEYGGKSVEYLVKAEVSPSNPGRTSGPPEKCYQPEGGEVELKEVYYVDKKVRCPELSRSPRLHFIDPHIFPFKTKPSVQTTLDGRKCIKCQGTGYIKQSFRRPELDDLVDDEQVMEHLPEPDEPDYDRDDD